MYNLLVDLLPERVYGWRIRADFRIMILFELLVQDETMNDWEKLWRALALFYVDEPTDVQKAMAGLMWFYRCGKAAEEESGQEKSGKRQERAYDFEQDDGYIYAAFLAQYGIDLQDVEFLHWWKFRALFLGLNEQQEIVKIMGYRTMDLNGFSKAEKAHYGRLKALYRIKKPSKRKKLNYEAYQQQMKDYVAKRFAALERPEKAAKKGVEIGE